MSETAIIADEAPRRRGRPRRPAGQVPTKTTRRKTSGLPKGRPRVHERRPTPEGARLLEIRLAMGLTQARFGELLGLSTESISRYECEPRRPAVPTQRLAERLFTVWKATGPQAVQLPATTDF